MKAASIDIGTNSTRLLVAQINSKGKLEALLRQAKITRLGEGVNKDRIIKQTAIERTFGVLAEYKKILQEENVEIVRAAATSAVREARNSQDFLNQIKNGFGFEVEILSGKKEAELSFLGATYNLQPSASNLEPVLVIDVGGGSTELIVGKSAPSQLSSLDIGCVRLTEMFIKSDPPLLSEINAAKNHIRRVSIGAIEQIQQEAPSKALGLAGTFTTLSSIKQKIEDYDWRKVHGSKLRVGEIEEIFERLVKIPLIERKKVVGLEPERADVVLAGTLISLEILKNLKFNEVTVSEQDILDGLIISSQLLTFNL